MFDCDWSSDVCSSDLSFARAITSGVFWADAVPHGDVPEHARGDRAGEGAGLRGAGAEAAEGDGAARRGAVDPRRRLSYPEIGRASCRERVDAAEESGTGCLTVTGVQTCALPISPSPARSPRACSGPTPFLMVTSQNTPEVIARAKELGSAALVPKPLKEMELLAAVRSILAAG